MHAPPQWGQRGTRSSSPRGQNIQTDGDGGGVVGDKQVKQQLVGFFQIRFLRAEKFLARACACLVWLGDRLGRAGSFENIFVGSGLGFQTAFEVGTPRALRGGIRSMLAVGIRMAWQRPSERAVWGFNFVEAVGQALIPDVFQFAAACPALMPDLLRLLRRTLPASALQCRVF